MHSWFWVKCPKCGMMIDSLYLDINEDGELYTCEDFKSKFGYTEIGCCADKELCGWDCNNKFLLKDSEIIADEDL